MVSEIVENDILSKSSNDMSSYNELIALINGCINRNGVQAITGQVLNGVLRAMVNQLGAGYTMGGVAHPTDDPGTPDAPVCYYASEVGTYTHFGNIQIVPGELALLCFDLTDGWTKSTMYEGFKEVHASIDNQTGTPAVNVTYVNGVLSFDFSNMKGNTGAAAGFGNVTAAVDGTIGTPGVSVQTSGPDTAKNIAFQFTGLKGETGVTSVIATVDNTSGTPQCAVSLNGQVLTLAFTGLKGAQGDTGVSADYPITIVNNLTTNDPTSALSAAQGVVLQGEISQLEHDVNTLVNGGFVFDLTKVISFTSGTSVLSPNNLLSGVNYPAGKILKIMLTGTSVLNKVQLVNNAWATIFQSTNYVDGDIITIKLSSALTSLGLYAASTAVIGTGDVKVYICTDYESSFGGRFDSLENYVDEPDSVTSAPRSAGTSFVWPIEVESGKTYFVKWISGGRAATAICTTSNDVTYLVQGEYIEFTPASTRNPYDYVGNTSLYSAPVLVIIDKESVTGQIIDVKRDIEEGGRTTVINVSRDGTSRTGRTIHYSGLTAIADAINSISDASGRNRYIIHIEGEFNFTNPLDLTMIGGGEYSAILMKDYVDIEGDGPNLSIVCVDFPAGATFHTGKTYSDYQPVYFYGVGGKISGVRIIGKNCRYALHIETASGAAGKHIELENCVIEYKGHPDYTGGYGDCLGTGLSSGQRWDFRSCEMSFPAGNAFACHTPLNIFDVPPVVNFDNCYFNGGINLHNYQVENNSFFNFIGCSFAKKVGSMMFSHYVGISGSISANYTRTLVSANELEALFDSLGFYTGANTQTLRGGALRIVSASTGTTSKVSFDKESSAFDVIVGDSGLTAKITTIYGWDSQYGYVYRDGGQNLSGQAFGTLDVSDNGANSNAKLGKRLGDCSGTNKVLGLTIDGVTKTITFDQDYTSMSNDDIISAINTALGGDAVADIFSPAKLYYPNINGLRSVICDDANSILAGMGVVFTQYGMRRAKNTDGYIDGICIEDVANGQSGRIITKGYIYNYGKRNASYLHKTFTTLDEQTSVSSVGIGAGISTTNDGVFDQTASPKLLRSTSNQLENTICWRILKN